MPHNALTDLISDIHLRRISAAQIADATGLDRKTVAAILTGETENPKLDTIAAIATYVGGDIAYSTADSRQAIKSGDISYYRTMISNIREELESKNRWLYRLFLVCLALVAAVVVVCLMSIALIAQLPAL